MQRLRYGGKREEAAGEIPDGLGEICLDVGSYLGAQPVPSGSGRLLVKAVRRCGICVGPGACRDMHSRNG